MYLFVIILSINLARNDRNHRTYNSLTEPIHILFQQPIPNYRLTNANALFCYLMLMTMHYVYKQANANGNSNDSIMI